MPECLAVDPADLIARAERLRSLGHEITPTAQGAERLLDELAAIGPDACAFVGRSFSSSWALSLHVLAGTLTEVSERLDAAAVTYAAFEELIAGAFN